MMRFVFYSVCRNRYFILARKVDKTNSTAFISILDMCTCSCSTFFFFFFFFFKLVSKEELKGKKQWFVLFFCFLSEASFFVNSWLVCDLPCSLRKNVI